MQSQYKILASILLKFKTFVLEIDHQIVSITGNSDMSGTWENTATLFHLCIHCLKHKFLVTCRTANSLALIKKQIFENHVSNKNINYMIRTKLVSNWFKVFYDNTNNVSH